MDKKLKFYHGLNKMMTFTTFVAFFNQPLSTTNSFQQAQEFSRGDGLILTLKSGSEHFSLNKYLSISWLSIFPHENEKLLYGAFLQIENIHEARNLTQHRNELMLLHKFQKMMKNQEIIWDQNDNKGNQIIRGLTRLIQSLLTYNDSQQLAVDEKHVLIDENKEDNNDNDGITAFGEKLFRSFCSNIKEITIRNFKSLPLSLYNTLFTKSNGSTISLLPITTLFPYVKEIGLNDLDITDIITESQQYADAVLEYIKNSYTYQRGKGVKKIIFKSKSQNNHKEHSALKRVEAKYLNEFTKLKWEVEYRLRDTHSLTFINFNFNL
eukprot:216237_1